MSIIDSLNFVGADERVRRYLLPARIVEAGGNVEAPEALLNKKTLQIGLSETEYTAMRNVDSEENAYIILDFGLELHGGVRIINYLTSDTAFKNDFDSEIRITFGESYSEVTSTVGKNGASNDHAVRQFTVPIPFLSDQEWGQTGFRFVKIELLTENAVIKLKSVLAVSIMRDYEYKGSFECNDSTVNKIYDTAAYTCHLCLQNMVWDGIKRDRLVWIGDMMPESMTVRSVFGNVDIVEKSLDFACSQAPLPGWMNDMPAYSMWWILILKDWYMSSGDPTFLNEHREYILQLLRQLCDTVTETGDVVLKSYFLDWPTSENEARKNGVAALLRLALNDGAWLCEFFSEKELSQLCAEKSALIPKTENYGGAKQIAAFLSLAGLMDTEKAAAVITENCESGFSTFLSYFILKAVSLAGEDVRAIELMKNYYKAMLDKGATSFWEDYDTEWTDISNSVTDKATDGKRDIHRDFGKYCYGELRHSLCHGWASGPVPFLTERVLGINIVEPGCKTVKIEPHLGGLKWVKGTYPTPYGIISVKHTVNSDGKIETEISAPSEVKIIK